MIIISVLIRLNIICFEMLTAILLYILFQSTNRQSRTNQYLLTCTIYPATYIITRILTILTLKVYMVSYLPTHTVYPALLITLIITSADKLFNVLFYALTPRFVYAYIITVFKKHFLSYASTCSR